MSAESATLTLKERNAKARSYLWGIIVLVGVLVTTATGTYAYPETLAVLEKPMIVIHDISGDIAVLLSILYLNHHLRRTWRMKKQTLSRWTGIAVVAIWTVCAVTGIYGHFVKLEDGSLMWRLHFVTSIAIIILTCFHGAWAYRPRPTT